MKTYQVLTLLTILALLLNFVPVSSTQAASNSAHQHVRQLIHRGTTYIPPISPAGPGSEQQVGTLGLAQTRTQRTSLHGIIDRSNSPLPEAQSLQMLLSAQPENLVLVPEVEGKNVLATKQGVVTSFDGLNHFDQRYANGGNQFSLEPPDQGLCVGNGYVLQTTNNVVRVYDTSGNPVSDIIDHNSFYQYLPAMNRMTQVVGPYLVNPSCYYDPEYRRWFHVVLALDVDPQSGDFLGPNRLDIAVSLSDNPSGAWYLYSIPTQNDGTQGTPDHGCTGGACIGDDPRIGADKYGFYISTNEYALFAEEFKTAQIYAISKRELVAGVTQPRLIHFDNLYVDGTPGFSVSPALSPAGDYFTRAGGAQFFLSSMATQETGNATGVDNRLGVWGIFNTRTLDKRHPNLILNNAAIQVQPYGVPPKSDQKPGDFPLGQCINDTQLETPFGQGCWRYFIKDEPAHDEVISHLDSGDSRMQQVWYTNGRLWGALTTRVRVGGEVKAGIAYFILGPSKKITVENLPIVQGYVAAQNNNLIYPAIAALPDGRGVMTFTLVGQDFYPSAAYTPLDQERGAGEIFIAGEGQAPHDGYSGYTAYAGDPSNAHWGDYAAAISDGETIWFASEYIAKACTFEDFLADFDCGGSRSPLANWATHLTQFRPDW